MHVIDERGAVIEPAASRRVREREKNSLVPGVALLCHFSLGAPRGLCKRNGMDSTLMTNEQLTAFVDKGLSRYAAGEKITKEEKKGMEAAIRDLHKRVGIREPDYALSWMDRARASGLWRPFHGVLALTVLAAVALVVYVWS